MIQGCDTLCKRLFTWKKKSCSLFLVPFLGQPFILALAFLDLHDVYKMLAVSIFQFTWCFRDPGSLLFSIYMMFTGSWQSPSFNLHDIYRILAVSLFQFTWYLQDLGRFTWYLQDLGSLPFSIYMMFTGSWQYPFFDIHNIYRILAVSLFRFTWCLQDLGSLPFLIYMMFTGS